MADAIVVVKPAPIDERSGDDASSIQTNCSIRTDTMFAATHSIWDLIRKYESGPIGRPIPIFSLPNTKRDYVLLDLNDLKSDYVKIEDCLRGLVIFASKHPKIDYFDEMYTKCLAISQRMYHQFKVWTDYVGEDVFTYKPFDLLKIYNDTLTWRDGLWVPRTVNERVRNFRARYPADETPQQRIQKWVDALPAVTSPPKSVNFDTNVRRQPPSEIEFVRVSPAPSRTHSEKIRVLEEESRIRLDAKEYACLKRPPDTATASPPITPATSVVVDESTKLVDCMYKMGFRFPEGHPLKSKLQTDPAETASPLNDMNKLFDLIKVANIFSFIQKILASTSHSERISAVLALAETYGFVWRNWAQDARILLEILASNIKPLLESVDITKGEFKEATSEKGSKTSLSNHADGDSKTMTDKSTANNHLKTVLGVVVPICGIAASCLGVLSPMRPVNQLVSICANNCKNAGIIVKSMTDLNSVASVVVDTILGKEDEKSVLIDKIKSLTNKFEKFDARINDEGASMLVDGTMTDLDKEFANVSDLWYTISKTKLPMNNAHIAIKNLFEVQNRVKTRWANLTASVTIRQEPTCLWLFGPPGVGKSRLVNHIVTLLSKLHERQLTVYSRNASEPYWSGYCGHDVLVYDDFASATEAYDVKEFIPVKSCNPFPVQMAAVEEKGQAFTSKYIIICSNHSGLKGADGLSNCDAIDRRRDLLIRVDDPVAVAMRARGEKVPFSHYKKNFSHSLLVRYNPIVSHDGGYNVLVKGISPTTIAATMFQLQNDYRTLYNITVNRDENNSDDERSEEDDDDVAFGADWIKACVDSAVDESALKPADIRKHPKKEPRPPPVIRNTHVWTRDNPMPDVDDDDFRPRYGHGRLRHHMAPIDIATGTHAFWFCGEPNTGKTTLARLIRASLEEQGRYCLIFDEFIGNRLVDAVDAVWDCYESKENPMVILISNQTDAQPFWDLPNRVYSAFERRVVKCVFKYKNLYKALATVTGPIAHDPKKISITLHNPPDRGTKASYSVTPEKLAAEFNVIKEDLHLSSFATKLPISSKVIDATILLPFTSTDYNKFSIADIIDIAKKAPKSRQFRAADMLTVYSVCKQVKQCFGGDFETACISINNQCVAVPDELQYRIVFHDRIINLDGETNKLVISAYESLDSDTESMRRQIVESVTAEYAKSEKFKSLITIGFDTGLSLLKIVAVIGFGVAGIVHTAKIRHSGLYGSIERVSSGKTEDLKDEVDWAKEVDQAEEDGELDREPISQPSWAYEKPDTSKRIAKSARKVNTNKEYCKQCHQDCGSCTCYTVESLYDGLVEDYLKTKHVKPNPVGELKPEAKGLRSIKPLAKRVRPGQAPSSDPSSQMRPAPRVTIRGPLGVKVIEEPNAGNPLVELPCEGDIRCVTELISHGLTPEEVVNEAQIDRQGSSLIPRIAKNTIFVGKQDNIALRGLMTHGHVGVTCAHYALARDKPLKEGETFNCFTIDGESYVATIRALHTKRDLLIFELAKQAPQFADIRHHLRKKSDNSALSGQYGALIYSMPDKFVNIQQLVLGDVVETKVEGEKRFGQGYNGHYIGPSYCPINSEKGYCGSAVLVLNSSIPRKIIAIHSAASTTHGLGAVVYQEDVQLLQSHACDILERCDEPIIETDDIVILSHQEIVPYEEPEQFDYYACLGYAGGEDYVHRQHQPLETRYWRSPLHLEGEDVYESAVLSQHDQRLPFEFQPYEVGLGNFNHPQAEMDLDILDEVVDDLADWYALQVKQENFNIRVLTTTEAINGISDIPSSNPIQRDTSAGYPWRHRPGVLNKSSFFGFDPEDGIWKMRDNEDGRALLNGLSALIGHARKGQRTAVVNIGALKDEPRPVKRIRVDPTTRAFWAAPLDKVLADRKYFHAACCALAAIHHRIPMKIGINPIAHGFNDLYYYHAAVSTIGWDADASGWDYSVPVCVMERVHRIFNRIYEYCDPNCTTEDQVCRRSLFAALVKPLVLYRETVVQLPGGNISGQSMTGQVNSFVNDIYTYYVWIKIFRQLGMETMCTIEAFNQHVVRSFYGDDLIITVSTDARPYFNPDKYVEECAKFGLKLTPADKISGDKIVWKHLTQLEFLKRNFKEAVYPNGTPTGKYCGALLEKSFHKMLDLIKCQKGRNAWEDLDVVRYNQCAVVSTIDSALLEAVNHGPVFFNNLRRHLVNCCVQYNIKIETWPTYAARFRLVWNVASEEQRASYDVSIVTSNESKEALRNMSVDPAVVGEKGAPSMVKDASNTGLTTGLQPMPDKSSGDMVPHIHEGGNIPAVLYERFILQQQGAWNSNQAAGTILASATISPFGCNSYVAYCARLFNAWCGGFLWQTTFAGTGYNGGKVIIFQLPPNLAVSDLTGVTDFTVFPNIIVDVKQSEEFSVTGQDIRNVLFHWTSEATTNIDATGGTVVWAVYIPLVNANGTACSVNWAIRSKVDTSFRVAELVPLSTTSDQPSDISEWQILLPGPTIPQSEPCTNAPITGFITWAYATTPTLTIGLYGQAQGNGTPYGRAYQPLNILSFYNNYAQNKIQSIGDTSTDRSRPMTMAVAAPPGSTNFGGAGYNTNGVNSATAVPVASSNLSGNTFQMTTAASNGFVYGGNFRAEFDQFGLLIAQVADTQSTTITPVVEESFVQWTATVPCRTGTSSTGNTTFYCTQTVQMIAALQGPLKNKLPEGYSIVFQVRNTATNLPIGYIRFSYPGYFSTNLETTNVIGSYQQVSYTPMQMVPMTQPLPTPTTSMVSANAILKTSNESQRQKSIIERLERKIEALMRKADVYDDDDWSDVGDVNF